MIVETNIFLPQMVDDAICNIHKFAKIADIEGHDIVLGFSGGKDSIVCYDLLKKSGVNFKPVFNYAFEDIDVVRFIREKYSQVEIHKKPKHYLKLIQEMHFFPTQQIRYCCDYFKEDDKNAVIEGVRRAESPSRKNRTTFEIKHKKNLKKYNDIFLAECTSTGKSPLKLRPVLNWRDNDIWQYIIENKLPYPKLYDEGQKRCGCMMCPLASLKSNLYYFKKYPSLLNFSRKIPEFSDLTINKTGEKYTPEQYLFIWLNHFREPSIKIKKQINAIYNRNIF
jgi:phosphoadenosine phosphosulfate reductase